MNETVTYIAGPVPGVAIKSIDYNPPFRLIGKRLKDGPYIGCKIIEDNFKRHGQRYCIIETGNSTEKLKFDYCANHVFKNLKTK